jgi:hypothetical protein
LTSGIWICKFRFISLSISHLVSKTLYSYKMNNLYRVIIGFSMITFYGCSTDENFLTEPSSGNAQLKCTHPNGVVITVSPGTDDTQALIDAFNDAKEAGPGSVVKLEEGSFTIGFIEIRDFEGYVAGSGKGKTIITNLPDLPCEAVWESDKMPALLTFIGGNVDISNLSFHLADGEPCVRGPINDAVYGDLCSVLILADYSSDYMPANRHINALIKNVDFIPGNDGGYGTFGTIGNVGMTIFCGANLFMPYESMPLSTGNIAIKNCYFENAICGPDIWGFDENSTLLIENSTLTGSYQQIFLGCMAGCDITVKNNRFSNSTSCDLFIEAGDMGFYYSDIYPAKSGKYIIKGNYFNSPAGIVSLFMRDDFRTLEPEEVFPQCFNVTGNTFQNISGEVPDNNYYGMREDALAIQAINLKDATIMNNIFTGTAKIGILIDGDEASNTWADNVAIIGNNRLYATYSEASVMLGEYSKNCKVVGVKVNQVTDLGVNNTLVGVNPHRH